MNPQEVLVEEKRRTVEEADLTKKYETQEQKRREMEKGAHEPMEVDKVKGKIKPSFQDCFEHRGNDAYKTSTTNKNIK